MCFGQLQAAPPQYPTCNGLTTLRRFETAHISTACPRIRRRSPAPTNADAAPPTAGMVGNRRDSNRASSRVVRRGRRDRPARCNGKLRGRRRPSGGVVRVGASRTIGSAAGPRPITSERSFATRPGSSPAIRVSAPSPATGRCTPHPRSGGVPGADLDTPHARARWRRALRSTR